MTPTSSADLRLLTAPEAARVLRISRRKLTLLAREGKITPARFGRAIRFDPRDVESLISAAKEVQHD
jgi:excisionase family DNA binding protein